MENEELKDKDIQQNAEQEIDTQNAESASTLSEKEQLEEQLANEKDKFLRLFAEFENFRKRTARERLELFVTANEDVMRSILPVLDDFDRAIAQMET